MAVTEAELAAILDHCRSLIDAADEFDDAARARAEMATAAIRNWEGTSQWEFDARFDDEATDLAARVRRLRAEADEWAQDRAETVNGLNGERREAAVDRISSGRGGVGESFVDLFVSDDSADHVRAVEPVRVPVIEQRYAATGGLESF